MNLNHHSNLVQAQKNDKKNKYKGCAVQCYNDDAGIESFGEMEYHAPAIGKGTGSSTCSDCSQVWAFEGREKDIIKVAKFLLGDNVIAKI